MGSENKNVLKCGASAVPRISWLDRSEIAARFIRPGDTVLDLGCGAQTLRRFLPASVGYIPVDRVKLHPDTWVADLDSDFELPERPFNVVTCIGLFTHLKNPEALLSRLARAYPGTFIIYTWHTRERSIRFERYVSEISPVMTFRSQPIFTGVLTPNAHPSPAKRSLSEVVWAYTPTTNFLSARWALLIRRIRRGGNNGAKTELSVANG